MLLEKLISGQEITRSIEEKRNKQYARIRQKARRSLLKKIQRQARRAKRTARGDASISISAKEMNRCNDYLPIGEEYFEDLLKTRGWEVCKLESSFEEEDGQLYFTIRPIRD